MSTMLTDNMADKAFLESVASAVAEARKTGVCSDGTWLLESVLNLRNLEVDKTQQLNVMLEAIRFFYADGNPENGLDIAKSMHALAIETSNTFFEYKALSAQGICFSDMGDFIFAVEKYAEAIALAQENADLFNEAGIWQNLATAFVYNGMFHEAKACSSHALVLFEKADTDVHSRISVMSIKAICQLNLDDIRGGITTIQAIFAMGYLPLIKTDYYAFTLFENYYTRLLIENKDYESAKAHAKKCREYAALSHSPRSDIAASVAEGLVDVFAGNAEIGIARLTSALAHAKSLNITIREAQTSLIKAHEHLGQHDKALEILHQQLTTQRQTQETNVLRQVERHLEQLHASTDQAPIEDSKKVIKQLEMRQEVLEGRIAKREFETARNDAHAAKQELSIAKRDNEVAKREFFRLSMQSLERVAVTAEMRDDASGEHSYRVGRLSSLLALEAGCDTEFVFKIEIAARLNDIGKIAIPDGILLKPGRLNASERQLMEIHAEAGADMLAKSNIPQIQMAEVIARYHHERWDGTGYPKGLKGDAIPLAARITALADVFDALTHKRPYKPAWPVEAALIEILSQRERHFDPVLTDFFVGLISRLLREGHDLDVLLASAAKTSNFNQAKDKIWDSLKLGVGSDNMS